MILRNANILVEYTTFLLPLKHTQGKLLLQISEISPDLGFHNQLGLCFPTVWLGVDKDAG